MAFIAFLIASVTTIQMIAWLFCVGMTVNTVVKASIVIQIYFFIK